MGRSTRTADPQGASPASIVRRTLYPQRQSSCVVLSAFDPNRVRSRACVQFGTDTAPIAGQRVLLPAYQTEIDRLEKKNDWGTEEDDQPPRDRYDRFGGCVGRLRCRSRWQLLR